MPTTVPGIANDSIVDELERALAREALAVEQVGDERGRTRPSAAPATAASFSVVKNEFQAPPVRRSRAAPELDAERRHVVAQRRRVVAAPRLDEAAGEDHRVDDDRERDPRQRERGRSAPTVRGSGMRMPPSPLPAIVTKLRRAEQPPLHAGTATSESASSTIASTAARPGSCCTPTIAKKIAVDSTSKLPPSTSGLPKSARLSMKPIRNALARPGRHQRQRDRRERPRARRAQRLRRLLERRADALDDADQHENAIGVNASICASQTPGRP